MKLTGKYSLYVYAFLLLGFVGCGKTSKEASIEKALEVVTSKFPQLTAEIPNQDSYFKLERAVVNGKRNFEIRLYASPDSIKDRQEIVVITNAEGESYAIPFFSNKYRDYWDFQFDSLLPNVPKTNTTFDKEFRTALNTLKLNDTLYTGGHVMEDLFISLLNCSIITKKDSADLHKMYIVNDNSIPAENSDSCSLRIKKNYEMLISEIYPKRGGTHLNAFWDRDNKRIYQFINHNKWYGEKLKFSTKVFRQDCVWQEFGYL